MSKRVISEINVTPFIDIMLILLVVFMITSPMMVAGVQVDLPKANSSPLTGEDKTVVITVGKVGDIYLQDRAVNLGELAKKILELSSNDRSIRLFVRGDKKSDYGEVVNVIDVIRNSGFTKIALMTDNENI